MREVWREVALVDDRQAVGVVLTLHGAQDVAVVAHHPGTSAAAVSVRIGRALIYLYDRPTSEVFAVTWRRFGRDAQQLSRTPEPPVRPSAGQVGRGSADAAVMIEARGAPPSSGQLLRPAGRVPSLRIQVGRVVFDVRDAIAFATTRRAFVDAEHLSGSALPAPVPDDAMRRFAFERAAAARPAARRSRGARTANPVSGAASAPSLPAPRLGRGWME